MELDGKGKEKVIYRDSNGDDGDEEWGSRTDYDSGWLK